MNKRVATIISLIVLSSVLATPAFSAMKAGTACKKVGSTSTAGGKKYTCVKSGKKMVWDKGATVSKPIPASTQSPTLTPEPAPSKSASAKPISTSRKYPAWESPISNLEISGTSKDNFKSWLATQFVGADNISISINPDVDSMKVQYITSVMKLASRTLLQGQKQKTHVYISSGDSWAISEVKKDFLSLADWSGINVCYVPNPYAACAWPDYAIVFFISQSNSEWSIPNQGVLQSGAHEYFHLVQDVLLRNSLGLNPGTIASKIPSWFYEGSATFIGTAYADESGLAQWNDMRNNEIGAYLTGRGTNEPLSSFKDNLVDRPQPEGQSHRPYGIGMLASEFIVASVGMDRFLDVFNQLGTGKPFNEAFATATGLSLEEFYTKFDSMRSQIGFFPVR